MNKASIIKLTDLISFIGLLALISTGALLKFSLPPGSGWASVWGLTRHEWGDIHFYISILFLVLMSVHLFFHLKFIKNAIIGKTQREQNYRLIIGIVSFVVLAIFIMAMLFSSVDSSGVRGGRLF